jgi:hypothetical protein
MVNCLSFLAYNFNLRHYILGIVTSLFEVFSTSGDDALSGADFLGLFKYLTAKVRRCRLTLVPSLIGVPVPYLVLPKSNL